MRFQSAAWPCALLDTNDGLRLQPASFGGEQAVGNGAAHASVGIIFTYTGAAMRLGPLSFRSGSAMGEMTAANLGCRR
jgi:hypothetical protein